ncbi:hypothetical protein QJS04_geneDACA000585 [Acorus gramineus]|uniref:Uncharacterized protein n=1 Tax=Acorus gramineus TaxID=55184 RepID=A0AAV9AUJ5_ACOGR|nr:hypothetical protein QJS04_geneDACA000585 [Acorus gramineus]
MLVQHGPYHSPLPQLDLDFVMYLSWFKEYFILIIVTKFVYDKYSILYAQSSKQKFVQAIDKGGTQSLLHGTQLFPAAIDINQNNVITQDDAAGEEYINGRIDLENIDYVEE